MDPLIEKQIARGQSLIKMIGAVGILLFTFSVLFTGTASSYESSLYSAYHPVGWAGFTGALMAGTLLILRSVWREGRDWQYGIAIIFSVYAVFFTLPVFRGYFLYGTPLADVLYHFGIARDILTMGSISDTNYPATHVLLASITQITGLEMRLFQSILAYTFFILTAIGWFIAGRSLMGFRGGLFSLIAALPLIFLEHHVTILPWLFALSFFPYLLVIIHRWNNIGRTGELFVTFTVLGWAIVFYHPITSIVTMSGIVVYWIVMTDSWRKFSIRTITTVCIIGVPAVFWHLSFGRVHRLLARVVVGGTRPGVASYAGRAAEKDYTILQLLWEFAILEWGTVSLYLSLGGIITLVIGYRALQQRSNSVEIMVAGQYYLGVLLAVVFIAASFMSRNIIRLSHYGLISTILLIGFAGALLTSAQSDPTRKRLKDFAAIGLCICLLTVMVFTGFTSYDSHSHVTHSTIQGSEWHINHQNSEHITLSQRMSDKVDRYLLGQQKATNRHWTFHRLDPDRQLPTHLGYRSSSSISSNLDGKSYLVTKQSDLEWSADNPTDWRRYTSSDLRLLEEDHAADNIYTNGEFNIWLASKNSTAT